MAQRIPLRKKRFEKALFTSDSVLVHVSPGFDEAIKAAWKMAESPAAAKEDAMCCAQDA